MKLHHQLRLLITLMTATCLLAILLATLDFQYNVVLHQRAPFSDKLEKLGQEVWQRVVRGVKQSLNDLGELFKRVGAEA